VTVLINGSYDSILVGTGKQKDLELLSENREWRRRSADFYCTLCSAAFWCNKRRQRRRWTSCHLS